jgi:hypothetical protein
MSRVGNQCFESGTRADRESAARSTVQEIIQPDQRFKSVAWLLRYKSFSSHVKSAGRNEQQINQDIAAVPRLPLSGSVRHRSVVPIAAACICNTGDFSRPVHYALRTETQAASLAAT